MNVKKFLSQRALERIHEAWPYLGSNQRWLLFLDAMRYSIPKLPFPIRFSLLTTFYCFCLLLIMPLHPMAIPITFGGGLSISLITINR